LGVQFEGPVPADPVVCAQDIPSAFEVREVALDGDRAAITVRTNLGTQISVALEQVNGAWRISQVRCLGPG
jgi:hypothetical protein